MLVTAVAITGMFLALYGEHAWLAGVLKVDRAAGEPNLWFAVVYSGGPDERTVNPAKCDIVYIDPKRNDPFTGRLLLDEMRELLRTKNIVYIRFRQREGGVENLVTTIEPFLKMKLKVELPP